MMEGQLHHVAACFVQTRQPEHFDASVVLIEKNTQISTTPVVPI